MTAAEHPRSLRPVNAGDGILQRLVADQRLHQADATPIADGIARPRDPHAVYLAFDRLSAVADDLPTVDWWRLVRLLAGNVTADQVDRVKAAAADLALLRAEGIAALAHFRVRATPAEWRAAIQDRQAAILAVAEEVTGP